MTLADCIPGDLVAVDLHGDAVLVMVGPPARRNTLVFVRRVDEEKVRPHWKAGAIPLEYELELLRCDTEIIDVVEEYPRRRTARAKIETDPNDPMLRDLHEQEATETDPLFAQRAARTVQARGGG